jgi:hypothetical protein
MFIVFYSLEAVVALVMEALVTDALAMEVVTEVVTGDGDDVAIPP